MLTRFLQSCFQRLLHKGFFLVCPRGKVIPLRGEMTLGRSRKADITLRVATVSGGHVALKVDGKKLFARDLGSQNGTHFGERPLPGVWVRVFPGRELNVGGFPLSIERGR